ncbi:MAG: c-type cytochrome [Sedimentisphaerales bacterium]
MEKKLLLRLFVAVGLFMLVYGCHNMAKEMSDGQKLYRAKCSSCHNIIAPECYDREKWHLYVDKYGQKMTTEEKQVVLQYLVSSD